MRTLEQRVRHRVWFSISPQTAEAAGLTIPQLQQFAGGMKTLTSAQVAALARCLGVPQ